jgi:hypothetical protein
MTGAVAGDGLPQRGVREPSPPVNSRSCDFNSTGQLLALVASAGLGAPNSHVGVVLLENPSVPDSNVP